MKHPWSERERALLLNWRKHKTMEQVASMLGRTLWSVKAEARKLGITKRKGDHRLPRGYKSSPEATAEAIRLRQTTDLKADEIAERVGISPRTLYGIFLRLGVTAHRSLQERCNREAAERLRLLADNPKRIERSAWAARREPRKRAQGERMKQRLSTPEGKEMWREMCRKGGRAGWENGSGYRYQESRLSWCPEEYRDLYRHLIYSKRFRALDAMALVIKQMEADEHRRVQAERDFVMGRKAA
jgi:AraC-like DNA-binding protein